jgi:nucleotide-binding universal stress UspA family protein
MAEGAAIVSEEADYTEEGDDEHRYRADTAGDHPGVDGRPRASTVEFPVKRWWGIAMAHRRFRRFDGSDVPGSSIDAHPRSPDLGRAYERILVCFDGSPESERALGRAAALSSVAPVEVTVVSVADPIYRTPPYTGYSDPREERTHARLLERATRTFARQGIAAASIESVGDAAESVVDAARECHADLIVVGSRHRSLLRRLLLGSVSGALVVDAPLDVLVVR